MRTKRILVALLLIISIITIAVSGIIAPSALDENQTVFATTQVTNTYITPDIKSQRSDTLDINTVVNVTPVSKDWYMYDNNGTLVYIRASDVSQVLASSLPMIDTNRQLAFKIFNKVNAYRISIGVQPLVWDETLYSVASVRAVEISTLWSHTRPNGQAPSSAFYEQGIKYKHAGENLLRYSTNENNSFNAWYNSPGHRASMENTNFNKSAVCVYRGIDGKLYITQEFTN